MQTQTVGEQEADGGVVLSSGHSKWKPVPSQCAGWDNLIGKENQTFPAKEGANENDRKQKGQTKFDSNTAPAKAAKKGKVVDNALGAAIPKTK